MTWKLVRVEEDAIVYTNGAEEIRLLLLYTHKELGKFYTFESVLHVPFQRKFIIDLIQQHDKIGIDKKELMTKIDEILAFCKDKPQGYELDIYNISQTIKVTLKDHWDYMKTALLTAATLIIQEGENIGYFDQALAERKISIWSKDPEMLSFFLSSLGLKTQQATGFYDNFTRLFSLMESRFKES